MVQLKEMSLNILTFLSSHAEMKACDIASEMGLSTRQVDAACTKSLIRYGFAIREAKLTPLLKKDYNIIKITPAGKRYLAQLKEADE